MASAGFIDKDIAYTSGVLHDIGRFALAVIRPREYAELLATHRGTAASILDRERALFDWDHCEVGHMLIVDWKLPSDFEAIVTEHHAPQGTDGFWGMAELIRVSCKLADAAGFAAFPGCEVTPYQELLDQIPARERRKFQPDVDALTLDMANRIHAFELL